VALEGLQPRENLGTASTAAALDFWAPRISRRTRPCVDSRAGVRPQSVPA